MKNRSNAMALLGLAVLVAGMTAPLAAHAQYNAPAPPAVEFRYPPRWVAVPGTSVQMVRRDERPAYDMFNVGSSYYIYDNGYWYRSDTWNGPFRVTGEPSLPRELRDVPQDEWQNYPSGWVANDNRGYDNRGYDNRGSGVPAAPRVAFRYNPTWVLVPGTSVRMIREDQRPAYDMFDYGSTYYIYENGYWYVSDTWNGPFQAMNEDDVPIALQRVPQAEWRDYPSRWAGSGYNRGNGSSRQSWRYDVSRAPAPPEIYFRRNPRWVAVPGTRVMVVRGSNRPSQDLFRLGGSFYLEVNGYWYHSTNLNGPYVAMDARRVPLEFASVPRGYWRSYPENWAMGARYRRR